MRARHRLRQQVGFFAMVAKFRVWRIRPSLLPLELRMAMGTERLLSIYQTTEDGFCVEGMGDRPEILMWLPERQAMQVEIRVTT